MQAQGARQGLHCLLSLKQGYMHMASSARPPCVNKDIATPVEDRIYFVYVHCGARARLRTLGLVCKSPKCQQKAELQYTSWWDGRPLLIFFTFCIPVENGISRLWFSFRKLELLWTSKIFLYFRRIRQATNMDHLTH